jgi:putative drug exporter of the RND superfamily
MLASLARFCFRRRRVVLLAWIGAMFVLQGIAGAMGTNYRTEFRLPDSESKVGFDILSSEFGGAGGFTGRFVYQADAGVESPEAKAAIEKMIADASKIDGILAIQSPFAPGNEQQIARQGALAGKVAYATVQLKEDLAQSDFLTITKDVEKTEPKIAGLRTELGGQVFAEFEPPESEIIGLAFAIVILVLAFGSVLAMGLPIGTALFGIGIGAAVVTIMSHVISMPDFTLILGIMIGLGVGIDYALFIVTRWREAVHEGQSWEDATVTAMTTAGRAVLFAGVTVVISLLGMLLMGLSFVRGLAIGAAIVVVFTMFASITLLPALLGFAQHRVELTRYRGLIGAAGAAIALFGVGIKQPVVSMLGLIALVLAVVLGFFVGLLKREVPRRAAKPAEQAFWYRWSRVIQHRPWPMALLGFGILFALTLPVFGLRLGFSDEGNYPDDTTTKRAYDTIAAGFGPGFNGPLALVSRLPENTSMESAAAVQQAVAADPNVAFVSPPIPNNPEKPTALLWQVLPKSSPQSVETAQLVTRLRADVLPAVQQQSGIDVNVTGDVAGNIDFASFIAKRLPVFFGAVLFLSFLLLMAVFRSLLVPLKAVVMNLLSIGAAYGVVVAVFQWGWLKDLFGLGAGAPIEPWAPMMMFAIVFGLSMDYEVFLMSRMREEFDRHGDNAVAVADGLAATARVITAAAAIMVFVFGSFLLEPDRQIKLFGVGLAMAVFLDATVVRMILVPATMELLGARNWWLPKWLDRILPKINVEGPAHAGDRAATAA